MRVAVQPYHTRRRCPRSPVDNIVTWMGMAKIGVVTALINHNLKAGGLLHTLRVAEAKAVLYGDAAHLRTQLALEEVREGLREQQVALIQLDCARNAPACGGCCRCMLACGSCSHSCVFALLLW